MAKKMETACSPSMSDSKYDEWAVKSAMDTLLRAEEYRADKKMMKLVQKQLDKQQRAITSIQDLREAAAEELSEPSDE